MEAICAHVESLFGNEKYSDVRFIVEGEIIPAHKNIVDRGSETLQTMWSHGNISFNDGNEIHVKEIDKITFKSFLWFQYTNKIEDLSIEALAELFKCADRFGSSELMAKCVQKLGEYCEVWSPRILDVFISVRAIFVTQGDLHEKCLHFIDENIIEAMKSPKFLAFNTESVEFFLKRDELNAQEYELLYELIQWGKNQLENYNDGNLSLGQILEPLIYKIRCTSFSTIDEFIPLQNLLVNSETGNILSPEIIGKIISSIPNSEKAKEIRDSLRFDSKPRKIKIHGQILLLGGEINGTCTSNIYKYNCDIGCQLLDYKMLKTRSNHAAVFNKSLGEIIVNANWNFVGSESTESIVFARNNYNSVEKISFIDEEMENKERIVFSASCFLDGLFYRIGAFESCVCEAFDVNSRKWKRIADFPKKLYGASAVACKNKNAKDVIFLFGGFDVDDINFLDKVYEYLPWKNTWILREDLKMPSKLQRLSATLFNETKIIICGGSNCGESTNEVYSLDLNTEKWTQLPSMKNGRESHKAVIYAEELIVFGGQNNREFVREVEIFDGEKWRNAEKIIDRYCNFAAVVIV